jgi:hypothetical protein
MCSALAIMQDRSSLQKFWRLNYRDKFIFIEALFWLAFAGTAIAILPFRYVGWLASISGSRQRVSQHARPTIVRRVGWAVSACARRVPWRAMCFEQGVAAQLMLRRRGIQSILYYGVAPDPQRGLSAHVWVRDGELDVVGGELASRYAVLTSFPVVAGLPSKGG